MQIKMVESSSDNTKNFVLEIAWYITNKCNLKCRHCYTTPPNYYERHNELSQKECKAVIKQIVELKSRYIIRRVGFLGGEPLMREDIFAIMKEVFKKDIPVNIGTNGTTINKKVVNNLKKCGVSFIQVSLEGASSEINDSIRGDGSFKKAIAGIESVIRGDIRCGIMMTLSKHNMSDIRRMIKFASELNVDVLAFNRFIPMGSGKQLTELSLNKSDMKTIIETIGKEKMKNDTIEIRCEDPLFWRSFNTNKNGGCAAGIAVLAIMPDGTVYPCRKLPLTLGNIKETSLNNIFSVSNPLLKTLRSRENLRGKCKVCFYRPICGGCRASAFAHTGSYVEEDPLCWLHRGL